MSQPANARKPTRKTPSSEALLAAACAIVRAEGLQGLTLRSLAQRLDVSVTVLTTHYGNRSDLLAAICRAAAGREARHMDAWRGLFEGLERVPPTLAASLAEAILDEQATELADVAVLYFELLHACAWDESVRGALEDWTARRRGFWDAFGRGAGISAALVDSGWWHGYMIAEGFYGLALDGDPAYRLLRRLGLQRLFAGGIAQEEHAPDGKGGLFAGGIAQEQHAPDGMESLFAGGTAQEEYAPDGKVFDGLGERMRHAERPAGEAVAAPAWVAAAARACGIRLAMQGVGALTHRAIAADAGIAHTTLSYRFPTQHDLVVAGLESITAHILGAVDADSLDGVHRLRTEGDGAQLDLARANLAVALAARRMPALLPHVAHMRSRRGVNLAKVLRRYLPQARGVDALCAQVVSLGLTGLTNAAPPGEPGDAAVAAAFGAAARWLAASR